MFNSWSSFFSAGYETKEEEVKDQKNVWKNTEVVQHTFSNELNIERNGN